MLANLTYERREFNLKGGSFAVQGISLESLAILIRTHFKDLEALFGLFEKIDTIDESQLESLALSVIQDAPGFVANVIALAAGEPDQAPVVQGLPFPVQVEALLAVGDLTFNESGGVKKFLPALLNRIGGTGAMERIMKKVSQQ